jgi:hypothetical protein
MVCQLRLLVVSSDLNNPPGLCFTLVKRLEKRLIIRGTLDVKLLGLVFTFLLNSALKCIPRIMANRGVYTVGLPPRKLTYRPRIAGSHNISWYYLYLTFKMILLVGSFCVFLPVLQQKWSILNSLFCYIMVNFLTRQNQQINTGTVIFSGHMSKMIVFVAVFRHDFVQHSEKMLKMNC